MVYIDTSVIVAMLSNEAKAQSCMTWFSNLKQTPVSSDWLITEFNSAIALKHRTGQLQAEHLKPILLEFEALINGGLKLMPVNRDTFNQAGKLIQANTKLRAGDALHLSVAMECKAREFATLDIAQHEGAKRLGLNGSSLL
jgi:predicted nucleic acid-binding protein